jgi:iron complex transport system substrate-binding protein
MIGLAPRRSVRLDRRGHVSIDHAPAEDRGDPFAALRELMAETRFAPGEGADLPRFLGGWIGDLGYGAVHWIEPTVPDAKSEALPFPEAAFLEIDRAVRDHLAEGLSVYEVDIEQIRSLRADVIVTQDQCEACAVPRSELRDRLAELPGGGAELFNFAPSTLKEVFDRVLALGRRVDRLRAAMDRIGRGERRLADLRRRIGIRKDGSVAIGSRPQVACIEWFDPLMIAGHWMPDVVKQAGGQPVIVEEPGKRSIQVDWARIREADPDVLLLMPCGFDREAAQANLAYCRDREGWEELRAVRQGRVLLADGDRYFNRPGPSLYRAIEELAEALHPRRFEQDSAASADARPREADCSDPVLTRPATTA